MSGTGNDIIAIVIVPVICLAFALIMIYYSASHPDWRGQRTNDGRASFAVPRQREPISPAAGPEGSAAKPESLRS